MEKRRLTKNGKTVEYTIDGGYVVVRDAATGAELKRVPVDPAQGEPQIEPQGTSEFKTCMRGCYPLKAGSPWDFAVCCAECATLLGT